MKQSEKRGSTLLETERATGPSLPPLPTHRHPEPSTCTTTRDKNTGGGGGGGCPGKCKNMPQFNVSKSLKTTVILVSNF